MKLRAFWLGLLMMLSAIIIVLEISPSADATTIYVDDSGGKDYLTIQEAIDAAFDGDTIYVYNGTYVENLVVTKTINLTGENRDNTIIDGGGSGDVVTITADWVNMTGFTVTGGGGGFTNGGLVLSNMEYCYVSNNNILDNIRDGMRIMNTQNSTIENNRFSTNGDDGIHMESSSNNNIRDNNATGNNGDGILVYISNENIVENNIATDNGAYGINIVDGSSNNTIINNQISNNYYGIYLDSSIDNNLTFNSMINNGIFIFGNQFEHWDSHDIDTSNTVNGKPVYYWKYQTGTVIPAGAGQVLLVNCSDIKIMNQNLSNSSVGVELGFSLNTTISEVDASNGVHGLYIYYSDGTNITGCNTTQNMERGIYIGFSSQSNVTNNYVVNNGLGILLRSATQTNVIGNNISFSIFRGFNTGDGITLESSSDDNVISINTVIFNSDDGIYVTDSDRNDILDNTVLSNNGDGIYVWNSYQNDINGNNNSHNNGNGINLRGSDNNNIVDNDAYMNQNDGIYLRSSDDNNLTGNDVSYNENNGIYIRQSVGNNVSVNNVLRNNDNGIYLWISNGNGFTSNNVSNNRYGFNLDSSSQNTLTANNASYSECGIYLDSSSNNNLTGNIMVMDGIFITGPNIDHWNTHDIDTSNTVNGKPVYYWKDLTSGTVPAGAGEVILANCINIDIENQEPTYGTVGIELGFSPNNYINWNNASSNNWYGIYIYYSNSNYVFGNTPSWNKQSGIQLAYSRGSNLIFNMMKENGVWIEGDLVEHWNTHEIDTSNSVNGKPIYYWKNQTGGIVPAGAGEVIFANCSNAIVENQELTIGTVGIESGFSLYNTFTGNNISKNGFGVYLYASNYNNISENNISSNYRYGIQLTSSSYNRIYHNNVIGNANQAYDDMGNNYWNESYSICGNYWSDYFGFDNFSGPGQDILGSDGVGDTWYIIDFDSRDYYPLMSPWDPSHTSPSAPLSLIANAGVTYVNVTWNPPASDGGLPVFSYRVYRGNSSGGETFHVEIGKILFFNDTNVTPGDIYYYKVSVVNIIGEGPLSNEGSGKPIALPLAPTSLTTTSGDSYVNLIWMAPSFDGGTPITNYIIYRGGTSGGEIYLTEIGNITNYNDTTVTNGNIYYYVVSAKNVAGEGPFSNEASATPLSIPGMPTGLSAIAGDSYIEITWTAPVSDGGSPITNYRIYRGNTPGGEILDVEMGNLTSYNDTTVTNGFTYYYKVSAINVLGEGPLSIEINATPIGPPLEPEFLWASSGDSYIYLKWEPPLSDGGSPITNYSIYRGIISGGETFLMEIGNLTSYNDEPLTNGVTYYYKVLAVNSYGEGQFSNEASATPATVPGVPIDLNVSAGDSYVQLTWTAPLLDGGSSITNYIIYRDITPGGETYLIEIENILSYNDTSLSNGITYYYKIKAKNAIGEGPFSEETSAKPLALPSLPQNLQVSEGNSYVNISWNAPTSDGGSPITNYVIYRGGTSGGEIFLIEIEDVHYYNDTSVINGITYYYQVKAKNAIGEGSLSDEISSTPFGFPYAPQNLQASAGDSWVNITWDAPASDGGSPIINYKIYRDTVPSGETFLVEIGNILYYNDTSVANGITYYYKIRGVSALSEGSISVEINAFPDKDSDGDNISDYMDDDDDNDGLLDIDEDKNQNGIIDEGETDPLNPDSDGDSHLDGEDLYPLDPNKWKETEEPDMTMIWVLLLLIVIVVIILVLLVLRKKGGKPKEMPPFKRELPPPPSGIKKAGTEGDETGPGELEEPKKEIEEEEKTLSEEGKDEVIEDEEDLLPPDDIDEEKLP